MKKILLTLLAVFLLGTAVNAQTANCPAGPRFYPDVPTGHWASTAVSRLSDLGVIIGFPDGLYRGNENLTRYQAALMFFRLIECYFPIIPQGATISSADLDALRRAIHELTGRVGSVEAGVSANAGSIAAIETNLASNVSGLHARIDELQGAIAAFSIPSLSTPVVDDAALQALRNQLEALQVKADTALATAQNAETLATAAGDVDLTAIQNRIDRNQRSINDLNDLAADLNADVARLEELINNHGHDHGPPQADITSDPSDFLILLRRKQIDLEDRVSALEQRGTGDVDDLARRVDIIEGKLFEFSGSLELTYYVRRHSIFDRNANDDPVVGPGGAFRYDRFDIDRIFGEGFKRDLPNRGGHSAFTSGVGDDDDEDDYERITDINGPREGKVDADIEIAFGFANGSSGCGFPRKLDCFTGIINLELDQLVNVDSDDDDSDFDPFVYAFNFTDAELHYSPIGGSENLKFEFGRDLDIDFTGYVVDTGDSDEDDDDDLDNFTDLSSGFAAHFDATDYLGAFDPRLTFFYGTNPATERAIPATYAWGARAELGLLDGDVNIGGSFATKSSNAGDYNDELGNNIGLTVFGVDGQANIGIFTLDAEFASETLNVGDNVSAADRTAVETKYNLADGDSRSLIFAILGIDTTAVRLGDNIRLKALELNYRDIPLGWNGINGEPDGEEGDAGEESEFDLDQKGFAVKAGVKLFIFNFNAYFDSYTIAPNDDIQTTAFGAEGDIDIFSGIAVTGFFRSVSIDDGTNSGVVDSTEESRTFLEGDNTPLLGNVETTRDDARYVDREFYDEDNDHYTTGFGIGLKHNGRSSNALIRDLNFEFIFGRINAGYDTTLINFDADYRLNVGPLRLRPYFGFQSIDNPDADGGSRILADYTRIEAGTDLVTKPVNVIFKPSLLGAVNFWNKAFTFDNANNDFTASVFQFSVGLRLNEFLFSNSALTAKYGSYNGTNITVPTSPHQTVVRDNNYPDERGPSNRGDDGSAVNGFEVIWNYYDLELAYGLFNYDPSTDTDSNESQGQAFRIKYKVTF